MKKWCLGMIILALVSCGNGGRKEKAESKSPEGEPLAKSNNNDIFNRSFGLLLGDYYQLKDQFITENDSLINYYARLLMADADSLKLGELKADSAIVLTARSGAESISDEIKGLLGEPKLEEKRKSFYTLSEQLYDLIRTVQYDKAIVYHVHCAMAFNNAGANWLSNSPAGKNPYLPKATPDCGEVTDSLNFNIKKP